MTYRKSKVLRGRLLLAIAEHYIYWGRWPNIMELSAVLNIVHDNLYYHLAILQSRGNIHLAVGRRYELRNAVYTSRLNSKVSQSHYFPTYQQWEKPVTVKLARAA